MLDAVYYNEINLSIKSYKLIQMLDEKSFEFYVEFSNPADVSTNI